MNRRTERWWRQTACGTIAAWLVASACAKDPHAASASGPDHPVRGGTLEITGTSDVDHLNPESGTVSEAYFLYRLFTRQLFTFASDPVNDAQDLLVADLAREIPTEANGGISHDGLTYTIHLRGGARWNTTPVRLVTASDVVRGIQLLCNPVDPTSVSYFTSTIAGMPRYCEAFARVAATPDAMARYVNEHPLAGVRAADDSTVVFTLAQPTVDFTRILTLPAASAVPVEYLSMVPDGRDWRTHTISDGPYQITRYIPNREYALNRNPVWDAAADPLRPAYVDSLHVTIGVTTSSAVQQLQAGTVDLQWDMQLAAADLAPFLTPRDPNLVIGPTGALNPSFYHIQIDFLSPNAGGAVQKLKVRQALAYAIDRAGIVQIMGGADVARSLRQAVPAGASGYVAGFDPYPLPGDHGDSATARRLLSEAGYASGVTLKLVYGNTGVAPQIGATLQASFAKAGITLDLLPVTTADLYGKYLGIPDNAKRGLWDLAITGWVADWQGGNGRSVVEALYDGRHGANAMNVGGYNNDEVNRLTDQALSTRSDSVAEPLWIRAATQVMADVAAIPLVEFKGAMYHASRVHNCVYSLMVGSSCDPTMVWIAGGAARTKR